MQKILVSIVILVALCVVARLAIHYVSKNLVATGVTQTSDGVPTLAGCGDKLNCISSTSTNARYIDTFTHTLPDETIIKALTDIISAQPGTTIVSRTADYAHVSYKTLLLGYTDDIEILLDKSTGATSTLQIRSASRIGQSDLGANRKRLEALRELVAGKI